MNNPKVEGTYTSAPERRFVERARHTEKGKNIDEELAKKSTVIPNPELSDDDPNLEGLDIDGHTFKVPQGQTYTAGNGISIVNNVISVDYANADTEAF